MPTFGLVWTVMRVAVRVLFRRLARGPKHPAWSWSFEVTAELARKLFRIAPGSPGVAVGGGAVAGSNGAGRGDPMRRMATPIPPWIGRHTTLERGELSGLASETHAPRGADPAGRTLLYLHGGGYITCSPRSHRGLLARLCLATGGRCVAVDYRKAPEHPFPAAIDDALRAYRALLAAGQAPERLAVGGDSAGGGLTLALLQRLRAAGEPLPACVVLLSPWVDLEGQGQTIEDNSAYDYLRPRALSGAVDLYLAGHDRRDPLASAIHADLSGLPPILMQTGSAELFCSENLTLAEHARRDGVELIHEVEEGMVHVYQLFADLEPRARRAIERIGEFVRAHCG